MVGLVNGSINSTVGVGISLRERERERNNKMSQYQNIILYYILVLVFYLLLLSVVYHLNFFIFSDTYLTYCIYAELMCSTNTKLCHKRDGMLPAICRVGNGKVACSLHAKYSYNLSCRALSYFSLRSV